MQEKQKLDFEPAWKGLLSRKQDLDLDPLYAEIARNVEFYGGVIGKRQGTQYLNGWGTTALGGWVSGALSNFILDVSHLDVDALGGVTMQGLVVDASGFLVGDTVIISDGTATNSSLGFLAAKAGNLITVTGSTVLPRLGFFIFVRHPLNGTARVDGLFQSNFRNGTSHLIAACGDGIFTVVQSPAASLRIPENFPTTTVDAPWPTTASGTLTNVQTIRGAAGPFPGEYIQIAGAGVGGATYHGRVISVVFSTRTITVSPPTVTPPAPGALVTLFPQRVPGDTHFVQHANLTHIVSANTPPVKYNGSVIQRSGVLPPIEPVPAVVAAGPNTGDYTWRYKFRNSITGQESEPSPEMAAPLTLAGQGAALTLTRSPDPQVDQIRIYRTTAGGAGAWYFLAEIPNPPTLTVVYVDAIPDVDLGILMREFLDFVMPDGVGADGLVSVIALWPGANSLIGINQTLGVIVFSDQPDLEEGFLKPEAWPPDNQILVNYDDGDKPRATIPSFDSILVFKARSIFRVSGTPPSLDIQPVIFRQDQTGVGVFNQKAIVSDQNEVIFPGQDGFYRISRWIGFQSGFESQRISRPIDAEFDRLTAGRQPVTHAVFFRQRRQLRVWFAMDSNDEPSEQLVYQFEGSVEGQPHGWSEWSVPRLPDGRPPNAFILDQSHLDVDRLGDGTSTTPQQWPLGYTASCVTHSETGPDQVVVGSRQGDVLRMDTGTGDAGALPYPFQYRTSWFAPAGKGYVVRGRMLNAVFHPQTAASIVVTVFGQFAGGGSFTVPVLPSGGFILDVSRLDVDRLGGSMAKQYLRAIFLALAEYLQIDYLENSNTAAFSLMNFTLHFQALPSTVQPETVVQML